ncbi:MAG TPA: methionyl-tRNA formyltransferase, partial [Acidimicrobiales bacterium]|nr:methionyl-tRNA formyltransferase [Acidimicrobiales bacterium]
MAYLGTPAMAVPPLGALVAAGHEVAIVVSAPDRKRGRGGATTPSPVKAAALAHGIPVVERVADILGLGADLAVVVAFGQLIKPDVLDEIEILNIHFSLLPRWRGAAPVERAILAGDAETGVCLMKMDVGLDTGPVYATRSTPIEPHESATELGGRLVEMGSEMLVEGLADYPSSLGTPVEQVGEATYARKIDPAELVIDWATSAVTIDRQVRALGRAHTTVGGARLIVKRAAALAEGT